jgi:DnaJ-class molecular chaperone
MTRDEACKILDVPPDASEEEVQRAFRRRAKQTHPDTNRSCSSRDFQDACDARDTLLGRGGRKSSGNWEDPGDKASADEGATSSKERVDPVEVMKGFLERKNYEVTFDGFEEAVSVKGATDQARSCPGTWCS